jgi:copper transport protein
VSRRFAVLIGVVLTALALASLGGGTTPLEAHALLVRADPPANAQLRDPPTMLTLYFSEPLEHKFSDVRVMDQKGNNLTDHVEFDDTDKALMRVFLKPVVPGYLSVGWSTVSAVDGHRVEGSYPLTILQPDGSQPPGTPIQSSSNVSGENANPGRVVTKFFLLVAGCVLVGALAFLAYVMPGLPGEEGEKARGAFRNRLLLVAGVSVVVLAVVGVIELFVQASLLNSSVGSAFHTSWGKRWFLRNLILIQPVILLIVLWRSKIRTAPLAFGALIGAASYLVVTSSVSHSAAGGGAFWAATADFIHLLAASVWIGMLSLLAVLFFWARRNLSGAERYPLLAAALQRFSAVAVVSVALLLFSGVFNGVVGLGRFADLVDTGYGRTLLIKLLLLLPLLAIGASNAYLLRPDFVEAADSRRNSRNEVLEVLEGDLNRRIRWELLVAVAVLAVVAVLVQITPSRGRLANSSTGAGKYVQTADAGDIQVTLLIDPAQPGDNTFEVDVAGRIDLIEGVRLEFTPADGSASASRLELQGSTPPTYYVGKGPYLPTAGNWNVVLNIRRIQGTDTQIPFKVKVTGGTATASAPRIGGQFDSPIPLSATSLVLLIVSAAACVAIVLGSVKRPGLPEGYVGWLVDEVAYRLAPINIRPVWSLGILVVVGIALGLVLGSHVHSKLSPQQATAGNPVPATADSIARGRMLFTQNCTVCHGEDGRGDGPAAKSLSIPPANLYQHIPYHADQFFFGVMSKGLAGVMPAFEGQISETDRWNILNYLRATFTAEPATQ